MTFSLECLKIRRTGFVPAFIAGGLAAAAVPILNTAVRTDSFTALAGSPVQILLSANWQMMAMLNVLLLLAGACIMYHTEFADNAIQKINTLPISESGPFFGKLALIFAMCIVATVLEACAFAFCTAHWFELSADLTGELLKNIGYSLVLMLPAALFSLFLAAAFKNMWISLGIGVVCVFAATMLPADNFVLSLFPFALPFQIFAQTAPPEAGNFIIAAAAEAVIIGIAECVFIKIRRSAA